MGYSVLDGGKGSNSNGKEKLVEQTQSNVIRPAITTIENKKRKTGDGLDPEGEVSANTELHLGLDNEEIIDMDQDITKISSGLNVPKNELKAGSKLGVRLSQ